MSEEHEKAEGPSPDRPEGDQGPPPEEGEAESPEPQSRPPDETAPEEQPPSSSEESESAEGAEEEEPSPSEEAEPEQEEAPPEREEEGAPAEAEEAEEGKPGEEAEAPEEEPEAEEPALPPPCDGLDSGLAWFGAEAFVPPAPTGYLLPRPEEWAAQPEAAGAAATAEALALRRQRIRERLEARRKEAEALRRWYQRIPLPVLLMMPATIFIIGWVLYTRPWDRIPSPERLDEKLLQAAPVESQDEKLQAMGVEFMTPPCWQLLPGGILVMDSEQRVATVEVQVPAPPSNIEVSCEACLLQGFEVWLGLDGGTALGLVAKPEGHYIRKRIHGGGETRRPHEIQHRHWYGLKIRVEPGQTRYFVNGYELGAVPRRPASVAKVQLTALTARAAFRNLKIEPIEAKPAKP